MPQTVIQRINENVGYVRRHLANRDTLSLQRDYGNILSEIQRGDQMARAGLSPTIRQILSQVRALGLATIPPSMRAGIPQALPGTPIAAPRAPAAPTPRAPAAPSASATTPPRQTLRDMTASIEATISAMENVNDDDPNALRALVNGGPDTLAALVTQGATPEQLSRAREILDEAKNALLTGPMIPPASVPSWIWVVGALGIGYYLYSRSRS